MWCKNADFLWKQCIHYIDKNCIFSENHHSHEANQEKKNKKVNTFWDNECTHLKESPCIFFHKYIYIFLSFKN